MTKTMIAVIYQPFAVMQKIFIYQNNKVVEQHSVELSRINDCVNGLTKRYEVSEIKLIGNSDYLREFRQEMFSKFEQSDILVSILSK